MLIVGERNCLKFKMLFIYLSTIRIMAATIVWSRFIDPLLRLHVTCKTLSRAEECSITYYQVSISVPNFEDLQCSEYMQYDI